MVRPRRALSLAPLALCAAVAARQYLVVRRGYRELHPPEVGPVPAEPPRVTIVLPMRNEAAHVDGVVASLLAQDWPVCDLLVVDDGSTDATPALLAEWAGRDPRVHVHRVETLPDGWAGKAHALHTGAGLARGDWLLFTDADTRHAPQTLRLMVGHAIAHQLDLLSAIADLAYIGAGMKLLTPIGAISLLERATPDRVRDPDDHAAIAVGQYILIARAAYERSGGYANPVLRGTFADDVHLAEVVKRGGGRLDLVSAHGLVSNEQWATWESAWRGWRKSVYGDIAARPWLGLAGGLTLLTYGLLPLVALARAVRRGDALAALLAIAAVVGQCASRRPFDREAQLAPAWTLTAPAGWSLLGLILLSATRLALARTGADWKGRAAPTARS